jgi:hypothetical protein
MHNHDLYWRSVANEEEDVPFHPLSKAADLADRRLEGTRLKRIRERCEDHAPRYQPVRR